jgi:hypothetical protein
MGKRVWRSDEVISLWRSDKSSEKGSLSFLSSAESISVIAVTDLPPKDEAVPKVDQLRVIPFG